MVTGFAERGVRRWPLAALVAAGMIAAASGAGASWSLGAAADATRPAAPEAATEPSSEAAVADGLSVEVRAVKAELVEGEQPAFVVTLKNVSDKPYQLWNSTFGWTYSWQIGGWAAAQTIPLVVPSGAKAAKLLKPGESLEARVGVGTPAYIWTPPTDKIVHPRKTLPVGEYDVFVIATFDRDPDGVGGAAYWRGRITSKTVKLTVVARPAGTAPATRGAGTAAGR